MAHLLLRPQLARRALPTTIPPSLMSQVPAKLKPASERRQIIVHKDPPSEYEACKFPFKAIDDKQIQILDPTGARSRLFDPRNRDGAKPGDIILATFKTGEPFSGVAMSIKYRGPHTSVLLRNQVTRVGTEMDIKVFSPLVQSMEVAQKAAKRPRRARLFYLRKPEHDRGSVQKIVDAYLRQRAALVGGGTGTRSTRGKRPGGRR